MNAAIEMDSLVATETVPEFRIAIIYETKALGAAALRQCERLTGQFRDSFLFRIATESFIGLDSETQFQRALAEARGASMIFISSAGSLPASLLRWLKECLEHRDEDTPVALVDMTSGQTEDAASVHRLLKEVAETNHLDLISQEQFSRHRLLRSPCEHQDWIQQPIFGIGVSTNEEDCSRNQPGEMCRLFC